MIPYEKRPLRHFGSLCFRLSFKISWKVIHLIALKFPTNSQSAMLIALTWHQWSCKLAPVSTFLLHNDNFSTENDFSNVHKTAVTQSHFYNGKPYADNTDIILQHHANSTPHLRHFHVGFCVINFAISLDCTLLCNCSQVNGIKLDSGSNCNPYLCQLWPNCLLPCLVTGYFKLTRNAIISGWGLTEK